jgi:hypothetical protein
MSEPTIVYGIEAYDRLIAEQNRVIIELRAILAPVLDDPWDPCDGEYCVFCHEAVWRHESQLAKELTPDCPTHEPTKSRLLGR